MSPSTIQKEMPSSGQAFRRFWRRWIGMLIFPPVMFVAGEFLTIPGPLLIILLFLAAIPAITPYLLKQAPFGYWVLVCCGWMGAGGVGAFLLMIIRLVMGTPIDGQG